MNIHPFRVLFLSRRDSARSVVAEAIMNHKGGGRFSAYSAGVTPAEHADPIALKALVRAGFPTEGLHPKSYAVFAQVEPMDFVFTLSDTARGEPMPEWPGHPVTAHWACDDPMLVEDDAIERALAHGRVLAGLERRIDAFMQLPFQSLDRISLKGRVDEIGAS